MSVAMMEMNHKTRCKFEIYARVWQAAVVAAVVSAGILIGYAIREQRKAWLKDAKTIEVYAEGIQLSHSAVVILGQDGTILKSNTFADEMFAPKGEDISGRNIHDFCVNPDARYRGADGLAKWFESAKDGERMSLLVTAKTPKGSRDIAIMATTVKPTAGSDVKAMATINYADRFEMHDFRKHNDNQ
jgi:PAS domain-containing protein